MAFDKIRTKHDYIVWQLFDKIFEQIKLATPKKGFPYIEHDLNEVKYYPNINHEFYGSLKSKHYDEDLKHEIEFLDEEGEYYDLETLKAPQFHNTYLYYSLMLTKFNHYYPYTDIRHTYHNHEHEMEKQNDYLEKLFVKEFYYLPSETSEISKKANKSVPSIHDFFTYPNDESTNLSRFKEFTIRETMNLLYEENLIDNLEGGEISKKLAKAIIKNPHSIIFPNEYVNLDFWNEEILIFSDFIRVIYSKNLDKLVETNIYDDIIIHPHLYLFEESLEEYEEWSLLNEFAGEVQADKLFFNYIEDTDNNVINNPFELLMFKSLYLKYSTLDKDFDTILQNTRLFVEDSENLTDSQFIKYLIDFYTNILVSNTQKLCIFRGLKLTKKISDLYIKLMINLLERKKINYEKKLHEEYVINPNLSKITLDDFMKPNILDKNKKHNTYLDQQQTYFLMLLLKKENVFPKDVSYPLLRKATEALTGNSSEQLRQRGSNLREIIGPTQKGKYKQLKCLLKNMLIFIKEQEEK